MATRDEHIPRAARRAAWQKLLESWSASGQKQAEFCRRQGLSQNTFSGWKRRLSWRTAIDCPPSSKVLSQSALFVPVRVRPSKVAVDSASADAAPLVEIVLRNGRVLRVALNAEYEAVARLALALEV